MKKMPSRQTAAEFIRFAVVGTAATGIHYAVYFFLQKSIAAGWAYAIGYAVSFAVNFFLTAVFTFRTGVSPMKGAGFAAAHLCNCLLQTGLLYAVMAAGVNRSIAPLPVYCTAVPINFLMVRYVFKRFEK